MSKKLYRSTGAERYLKVEDPEQEYKHHVGKIVGTEFVETTFVKKKTLILDKEEPTPEQVDYVNKTKLFSYIEKKKWDKVLERLQTNPEEASIWVSRSDLATGKLQWRLLPLHSALYPVFATDENGMKIRSGIRAKIYVIEKLLKVYPAAVMARCDRGMTPLHLASRNSAPIIVITKLLQMYPKGLEVEDNKGRTPIQVVNDSNTFGKDRILHALKDFSYDVRMKHEVRDDHGGEYRVYDKGIVRDNETRESS